MAKLPEFQPNLVPEGHYSFQVIEEPEIRKTGASIWMIFRFKVIYPDGNSRKYSDVFFPGDEKYRQLLLIAGAEPDEKGIPHLSEMDTRALVGVKFEADIIHAVDRKDASKIRDTIANIFLPDENEVLPPTENDEVPEPIEELEAPQQESEDDEVPF